MAQPPSIPIAGLPLFGGDFLLTAFVDGRVKGLSKSSGRSSEDTVPDSTELFDAKLASPRAVRRVRAVDVEVAGGVTAEQFASAEYRAEPLILTNLTEGW